MRRPAVATVSSSSAFHARRWATTTASSSAAVLRRRPRVVLTPPPATTTTALLLRQLSSFHRHKRLTTTANGCYFRQVQPWRPSFSISGYRFSSSTSGGGGARSTLAFRNSAFSISWETFRRRLQQQFDRPFWRRLAIFVRYTRIPLLVFGVYSLGYQQGIVDCTKTPLALQTQILQSILASMGITSAVDENNQPTVQVIQEASMFSPLQFLKDDKHATIATVGHNIVCAARNAVQQELEAALREAHAELPSDLTKEQAQMVVLNHPKVQFWYAAKERIMGEELAHQPWQYVLVSSPAPNAFVTEVLPRRFFLTTSLLKVATTPDELAVVLGHELSHLILGHVTESNRVESILRSLEILLLSIDPTSGFLALLVIGGLAAARRILSARHSREHEYEADDVGLQLAARACYDTTKGSHVMRKMNELKVSLEPQMNQAGNRGRSRLAQFGQELLDTHPPSLERFERMQLHALQENFHKYKECGGGRGRGGRGGATSRMWGAVGSTPTPPGTAS